MLETLIKSNAMTIRKNRSAINPLMILSALICTSSGLIVQIVYHLKNADTQVNSMGLSHSTWTTIHKTAGSVLVILCAYHIYAHKKWYKAVLRNQTLRKKSRPVLLLSVVLALSVASGLAPWAIDSLSQGSQFRVPLIEIHDKISIGLAMLIIAHTAKRWQRII